MAAQQPTPSDDQVNAIAKQLYCPVCENIPLDVCPTTACAQWRELIRQKLAEGWTEQQIKEYFVEQYGARVIGTTAKAQLAGYLIPSVAILSWCICALSCISLLEAATTAGHSPSLRRCPACPQNPAQDEYIQRLEEEVRKR